MIDQIKIGKFIAAKRKEKSLTQAEVAAKLGITDRAVSKWERGLSLPDASIMQSLCSILGISITELLLGEETMEENYREKAEELILEAQRKAEEKDRYLLRLETVIGVIATVSALVIMFAGIFLTPGTPLMFLMIAIALAILIAGIYFALKIERNAGYYECGHCHYRYVPAFSSVLMAMHKGRDRFMKCPECGKKGWQKKVLTK